MLHRQVQMSSKCCIYRCVGGQIYWVGVKSGCKSRPDPAVRQGGREGLVLASSHWLTRQTAPHSHNSRKTWFLRTSAVTVTDIWHHPVCDKVPSSFLPRHVPACERDLDLSCHFCRFVWAEGPVGGVLLLPPGFCWSVLRAVCPWVYPAGPRQGSSFTLRAVRLPPTWNLPPGDRYYLKLCLSCDRFDFQF